MASCDFLACFRYLINPERREIDAEQNTAMLGALYASYVVETDKNLEDVVRRGRAALSDIRLAREQNNEGALARARAAGKVSAAKVKELRERSEKYSRLADSCNRAVSQLQEAKQYQATVGALAIVQGQYRRMRLDKLAQGAEDAAADLNDAHVNISDIGSILGAPPLESMGGVLTTNDAEMELEAELEALLGVGSVADPPHVHVQLPGSPSKQRMPPVGTSKLPTFAEYAKAIGA